MTEDPKQNDRTGPIEDAFEHELQRQLAAIAQEETPERLLELARDLQRLIRRRAPSRPETTG